MNQFNIATKCTLTDAALIESVKDLVSKLCRDNRAWTMSVPVDMNRDSDMLICELANRFEAAWGKNLTQTTNAELMAELVKRVAEEKPPYSGYTTVKQDETSWVVRDSLGNVIVASPSQLYCHSLCRDHLNFWLNRFKNTVAMYQPLKQAAENFIEKVETGKAKSVKSYALFKSALMNLRWIVLVAMLAFSTNKALAQNRFTPLFKKADSAFTIGYLNKPDKKTCWYCHRPAPYGQRITMKSGKIVRVHTFCAKRQPRYKH